MLNKAEKAFQLLQRGIRAILGIALAVIMCVVFAQTFTRYVVFHSIPWSEELSRFLFVALIALGVNVGISDNMLVRIDILDGYLRGAAAAVVGVLRQLVGLLTNAAFAYSTLELIHIGRIQKSPAMQIPMSFMYVVLLAGFVFASIAVLLSIVKIIRTAKGGNG